MKRIIIVLWFVVFYQDTLSSQSFQFISFNIRYDTEADGENRWSNRKQDVANYLEKISPTAFGIQEGMKHQVDFLNNNLTDYKFIGVGRDDGLTKGEYSAIFYNIGQATLLASGTFWLSETPESVSVGWDASMERICTYGKFEDNSNGRQFLIFNTHFDHRGPKAREYSAKLIVNKIVEINPENLPVVLMGDLNATPDEQPIDVLKEFMEDGLAISKHPLIGVPGTFNGFKDEAEDRRIDYIFTSKFHVDRYTHDTTRTSQNRFLSDHLPVLIEAHLNQ